MLFIFSAKLDSAQNRSFVSLVSSFIHSEVRSLSVQAMEEQKQNKKESIADASQKISDNKEVCKSHSSVFFCQSSAEPFQSSTLHQSWSVVETSNSLKAYVMKVHK